MQTNKLMIYFRKCVEKIRRDRIINAQIRTWADSRGDIRKKEKKGIPKIEWEDYMGQNRGKEGKNVQKIKRMTDTNDNDKYGNKHPMLKKAQRYRKRGNCYADAQSVNQIPINSIGIVIQLGWICLLWWWLYSKIFS